MEKAITTSTDTTHPDPHYTISLTPVSSLPHARTKTRVVQIDRTEQANPPEPTYEGRP